MVPDGGNPRFPRPRLAALLLPVWAWAAGCGHAIPIAATVQGCGTVEANATVRGEVDATVRGEVEVKMPPAVDPGPMVAGVVRPPHGGPQGPRIALIDVDGVLLDQNLTGLYSVGENPVAAFREKLEAAARDPRVAALVLRINSPGGGVTACDILAEELRQFREGTGKPVVACLMDVGTAGAYYLAVGSDRIVAHPTGLTGAVGVVFNHFNLADAMAQLNVVSEPVKSGPKVDMGTVTAPLDDESRALLQEMADAFRDRFRTRVADRRPGMTPADLKALEDGRLVATPKALELHMVDRLGYLYEAIAEAERLAHVSGAEVVLFHRLGYPAHSLYAIAPGPPQFADQIPFNYPGLDRSKLPTFLYLWQPDPTLPRQTAR